MGGACGTYGGQWRCLQGFGGEIGGKKDYLEDLSVDWRIILKWIFKTWDGGMDWIDVAQDRGRRRAVVNSVMSVRVL
jgi:hypothetical protein